MEKSTRVKIGEPIRRKSLVKGWKKKWREDKKIAKKIKPKK